jgi:sulfur-oxidizing protein SoxY
MLISSHFSKPMAAVEPSRRHLLGLIGSSVAVTLLPAPGMTATGEAAVEIAKIVGDRKPIDGKINLELPTIAENGLVVPLTFEVESPMTDTDYVKNVYFIAEGNPNPLVATFHFTPLCPKAAGSIRIRLAQTQFVVAIAEMSSGALFKTAKEVKVTIGGCGG